MSFCTHCGQKITAGAKFCSGCGKAVDANPQRKTVYDGDLHKCPNCGGIIDAFVTNCPSCGHELRGSGTTSIVHRFSKEIAAISNNKVKEELIRNFYVPNTREDIIEFFILAMSNIESDSECRNAWAAKLEQTYQKAKLTFGSTNEFAYLEELYQRSLKLLQKKRTLRTAGKTFGAIGNVFVVIGRAIAKSLWLKCLLMGALGVVIMVIGSFKGAESGDPDSPYYMMSMLGFFPLMAAFIIPMALHKEDKKESEDDDEE